MLAFNYNEIIYAGVQAHVTGWIDCFSVYQL